MNGMEVLMHSLLLLTPDYILFYLITLLWLGEFLLYPSRREKDSYRERQSYYLILLGILSSISLSLFTAGQEIGVLEGLLGTMAHYAGLFSYSGGIFLRYWGTRALGRHFTRDVQVIPGQELVSAGPYRHLRHPLYLGLFLLTLGVPLFYRSLPGMAYATLVMGASLNHRMSLEEKAMEDVLGEPYRIWKKKRYRFIPGLY